ncbi:MAG: hypothetical protein JSW48_01235 [Betaproteobacteria bacterium]|nr:MAG: hypothetical protein JSW48_01235 [Betaproteobacteria bacterium]
MFVLSPTPGAGLEIGRVTVNSKPDEPLDAMVPIVLAPGEKLHASCLSVASQQEFSTPEHTLLGDAKLTLLSDHGPIRITTSTPPTELAMSFGLRVQCDPDRISVRAVNLYLPGYYSIESATTESDLLGTTIVVRPGDSVYKLSRLIYPHDETAVAKLAQAIILANPALFPDRHGRPLEVGERLIIPDLRSVGRIVGGSRASLVTASAQPALAPRAAPAAVATRKAMARGKLRLQLTTTLDISHARNVTRQQRAALRPRAGIAGFTGPRANTLAQISALSSQADRMRQLQDNINARLARLEAAATSLKNAFGQARRPPALAAIRPRAASRTEPPRVPTTLPTKSASQPSTVPAKRPLATQSSPVETQPAAPTVGRSYAGFVLSIVLAIALVLVGRAYLARRALYKQRSRIDAILHQARSAASPLLGAEPEFDTDDTRTEKRAGPSPAEPEVSAAVEQVIAEDREPKIFHPSQETSFVRIPSGPPPTAKSKDSAAEELPAKLRAEMDDAMAATRAMFSDVDRFISLGRVQDAISLLEVQIKREPTDRDSWIKLMAVYRREAMDDDFDRTYVAFRDRFG